MKENKRIISIQNAPKAIGPYSQGVALKNLVFFSGQIAIIPATGKLVEGDVTVQTKQILSNIDNLLKSEGMTAENVVKTTVYITDMSEFGEVNAAYGAYFTFNPPARSCVEVSALPMGALVEIEIIAAR